MRVTVLAAVLIVGTAACGTTNMTVYNSAATLECFANDGAKVDRPGADYVALEADDQNRGVLDPLQPQKFARPGIL